MDKPPLHNKAAALYYDGQGAPRLSAKGTDATAEQIIAIAEEHWRPIFENDLLVNLLCQLELEQEIPENLFKTVAHIIAFAHELEVCLPPEP
ncbi:EscU/YscU/HrcU family type III secretion system export apparatus switch protein [Halioxenophilus aromaticivorans]|uniref:Flagellar biosynthetic protein FlhB n=1 Tax=Halioxenophilus aromaticivorans TaxID=1306992 RepID=A0AAV3TVY1_9ALTE